MSQIAHFNLNSQINKIKTYKKKINKTKFNKKIRFQINRSIRFITIINKIYPNQSKNK